MKEEYLFLDTNVFIDCNNNISELEEILKYSEKKRMEILNFYVHTIRAES